MSNDLATSFNVKLSRAIEKQPILFDHSHENYRKRLPSENCWDVVASETGVTVEKCKSRWRQIRQDYIRWKTTNHRNRNASKRPAFAFAKHLKFLDVNLSDSEEEESLEEKPDGTTKSSEPPLEVSQTDSQKVILDEDVPLAELKRTDSLKIDKQIEKKDSEKEEEPNQKNKEKRGKAKLKELEFVDANSEDYVEGDDNNSQVDDKDTSESTTLTASSDSPNVTSVKKPEFFIKQSNASLNCLIIGKKPSASPVTKDSPIDKMNFESSDDDNTVESSGSSRTRARGRGRPLGSTKKVALDNTRKLSLGAAKKLPIQKPSPEGRLTRLQRNKSVSAAVTNSLRSSTIKMSPLPRASLPQTSAKPKTQKRSSSQSPVKLSSSSSRDDIFPRPSPAPLSTQRAGSVRQTDQEPGQQQQQQQQQHQQKQYQQQPQQLQQQQVQTALPPHLRHHIGSVRPPVAPVGLAAGALVPVKRSVVIHPGPRAPVPLISAGVRPTVTTLPPTQAMQQRIILPKNTVVIRTTSMPSGCITTSSYSISNSKCSTSFSTTTTTASASSPLTTNTPLLTPIKSCEQSTQTDGRDEFSVDHFLEMVRTQMNEMNARQKMNFKQKIFLSLMETFDDATDFPANGQVQHFNINTPSGFENISDPELRLVRELVSMVSAAKHTSQLNTSPDEPLLNDKPIRGRPKNDVQRLIRPNASAAPGNLSSDDKKICRVLQMNNKVTGVKVVGSYQRKQSNDSNSSSSTAPLLGGNVRVNTFLVPSINQKTVKDPLTNLLSSSQGIGTSIKIPQSIPISPEFVNKSAMVRQMSRRYSVCGSVTPAMASSTSMSVNGAMLNNVVLKRRLPQGMQVMVPPQQRPRYSNSPSSAASDNTSLLRRVQQQSPTGAGQMQQKTHQISNIQGGAHSLFVAPNAVGALSPLKRAMVVANAKTNVQQRNSVSPIRQPLSNQTILGKQLATPGSGGSAGSSGSPGSGVSAGPTALAGVANLLSDSQFQLPTTPPQRTEREKPQTAGTIAADDFDMSRLKREPQDSQDDQAEDLFDLLSPNKSLRNF